MMVMEFLELRECTQYVHTIDIGDLECLSCWFKPPWMHCIESLNKTLYPLLYTGSTQEISRYEIVE